MSVGRRSNGHTSDFDSVRDSDLRELGIHGAAVLVSAKGEVYPSPSGCACGSCADRARGTRHGTPRMRYVRSYCGAVYPTGERVGGLRQLPAAESD